MDDTDFVLRYFAVIIIQSGVHTARLPTDDGVLAGFRENKVAKPTAAVNVISVDVSGAEVGEVTELSGEDLLGLDRQVVVG